MLSQITKYPNLNVWQEFNDLIDRYGHCWNHLLFLLSFVAKEPKTFYTEIERIMSETRTLTFAELLSVPSTILRTQDSRIA